MPDGPRYEDDFYAWSQYQAEILRTMTARDNRFDRANVAEEIEDLGKSERDAVRSEVRRILEHFLKLAYSPATEPSADWMASIAGARAQLDDKLSPTLRHDAQTVLGRLYANARRVAALGLSKYEEGNAADRLPTDCPYTLDQVLAEDWYPGPAEPSN